MTIPSCIVAAQLVLLVAAGTAAAADPLIADVGGTGIRLSDLASFGESLPDVYKGEEPGEAADSLLLESLIDKTVLLLEAREMGIDREPWFEPKIARLKKQRMILLYVQREVNRKVVVTDEEILEQYRQTHRDRALRFAGILVKTREEALEVLAELDGGAEFGDLARARSLYEETRDQGGDIGKYLTLEATSESLREQIFRLKVGQLTEPLPFTYKGSTNYTVIKLLDEVPIPVSVSEEVLRGEVFTRKREERAVTLIDSLIDAYAPEIRSGVVSDLQRLTPSTAADTAASAGLDPSTVIAVYRGGQITVGDLQSIAPQGRGFTDSTAFVKYLRGRVIVERLHLEEAYASGLHQDPSVVSAVEAERQDLLTSALRDREVIEQVSVSPAEARAYYNDHPELFQTFEEIEVVEVLVAFPELAQQLKEQLEQGAEVEQVAAAHTIREGLAHHGGRMKLGMVTRYPEVYEAAKKLEVGAIGGPERVPEGYSVFKVLDRRRPELKPYHDFSKRRATAFVKLRKRSLAYKDLVHRLRAKYGVTVFSDELQKLHRL